MAYFEAGETALGFLDQDEVVTYSAPLMGYSGNLQRWSISQNEEWENVEIGGVFAVAAAFSRDGKTLAVSKCAQWEGLTCQESLISLWDTATNTEIGTLDGGPPTWIGCLAFSPDGTVLASCSDTAIRFWDLTTYTQISVVEAHSGGVAAIAFSPDGKTLASSGNATVRLWDLASLGIELSPFAENLPGLVPAVGLPPMSENDLPDVWIPARPIIQEFNGVEMVFVPAGCFVMGEGDSANEVCIEEPFWIDRTEVTNAQFEVFNGQAAMESRWQGAEQPREQITWNEARDFCGSRHARLPTGIEWEYAARGPDGWIYPWGNDFVAENITYWENSTETSPVGSKPANASWVGAVDMADNVAEWVLDLNLAAMDAWERENVARCGAVL